MPLPPHSHPGAVVAYDDANALVRVLTETTVSITFILQKKSKERAMTYHAYGLVQEIKMLNEWNSTKGLKRKGRASTKMLKQANDGLAEYTKRLPAGTDVKRHWSGKPTLTCCTSIPSRL